MGSGLDDLEVELFELKLGDMPKRGLKWLFREAKRAAGNVQGPLLTLRAGIRTVVGLDAAALGARQQ